MNNNSIYKKWVQYLKSKKLYGKYLFEVGNYLNILEQEEQARKEGNVAALIKLNSRPMTINGCFTRKNAIFNDSVNLTQFLSVFSRYDILFYFGGANYNNWLKEFGNFVESIVSPKIGVGLSRKMTRANTKFTSHYNSEQIDETKWYDRFNKVQMKNYWNIRRR